MRTCRLHIVLLLLVLAVPAYALVDPVPTSLTTPGWMADIKVFTEKDNSFHQFCKGALIAPQWVLSSGLCMIDPNHYLDSLYPGDDPSFLVKLGPNAESGLVDKFYFSDDYRIALFHIDLPSELAPLPLSTRTAAQLMGSQIIIWSKEKSSSVYNSFFNPGVSGTSATCKINGTEFVLNGAYCFVQTKATSSTTLYQATATVIDPVSASAPATALDKAIPPDLSGKVLYLDFRSGLSYPCHEDEGAPLLTKATDGSLEVAGVVAGVGAEGGLSVCGMSLANVFVSAAAIRSFVDRTYASYDFAARCPRTPLVSVTYTGGAGISLSWSLSAGADGYRVHYTTRQGQVPIVAVDVKNQTTINTSLSHGVDYLVAVTAYNANCSSAPSKPLAVNVDVQ